MSRSPTDPDSVYTHDGNNVSGLLILMGDDSPIVRSRSVVSNKEKKSKDFLSKTEQKLTKTITLFNGP